MVRKFTKEDLLKYSVHTLRMYARKLGVKQPTMLTKMELVYEIIMAQKDEKTPIPSKRGRPVINSFDMQKEMFGLLSLEEEISHLYISDKQIEERENLIKTITHHHAELIKAIKELKKLLEA